MTSEEARVGELRGGEVSRELTGEITSRGSSASSRERAALVRARRRRPHGRHPGVEKRHDFPQLK
jgi:hypothetical protein